MNKWPKAKLKELLRRSVETVEIRSDESYREITVKLWGKGVVLRGVVKGAEIASSRRFVARTGHLILSRIDARNGAIGIVPELLNGAVVTNDFPVFALAQDRVRPEFVNWLSKTASFVELCQRASEGTTNRVRLQEGRFLATEISLPPLEEQRWIVVQLEGLSKRVQEIRTLRQEQEYNLRSVLLSAFHRITTDVHKQPMGEVAPLVRRSVTIEPLQSYPELGIRSFGRGTFHKPALTGLELGGKRIFRIEPGDLLFSNVFAWEGAIAVARPEDEGRFGSHRFITCVPKVDVATSNFLRFFFLTDEGMEIIRAASPGGAGRNRTLGLEALAAIKVPMPPIEKQWWFDALQAEAYALRQCQAETAAELDALLPSVLDRAFRGEMVASSNGPVSSLKPTEQRRRKAPAPKHGLVHVVVSKPVTKHSKGIFYRRAALDCYLISTLRGDNNLGRTKIEKLSHLIESHCGVDLEREPVRDAAGPNDYPSRRKVESLAGRLKWYSTRTQADRAKVDYVPGPAITKSRHTAERLLGDRKPAVDALLRLMRPLDTKQSEVVATLYAAWNDLLLAGKTPTDDELIEEVRDNWHPEKRSIPVEQWLKVLTWMRKNQLVPRGDGRATLRKG